MSFDPSLNILVCIIITSDATLALGSRQRQGLARVRVKREAREAHLILSRVQDSVRE
jgi:hypothetical protein